MSEHKIGTSVVYPMPSQIQVFPALVTPEMARGWLADQLSNRSIKKGNVRRWARDIKAGDWLDTVQPIQFNHEGRLIDGQNRLSAIIEADRSVVMWIAVGVPEEHRRVLDTGATRTAGDVLGLLGVQLTNRNLASATARRVMLYETQPAIQWTGPACALSVTEIIDEISHHVDEYRFAVQMGEQARRAGLKGTWLSASCHASLAVLVRRHSAVSEMWADYHEGLATGANLKQGDPRLTLRSSTATTLWGSGQCNLLAEIKVWNAYVSGESLLKIYASSPRYLPMPVIA